MGIEIKPAWGHREAIRELFREYTEILIEGDPNFREYLKKQNFETEMAHLEMKYGAPWGRLYVAMVDGKVAGCIGLKKYEEGSCEIKRLYVRQGYRGLGIGKKLTSKVIGDAEEIGYDTVYLDTLPFLTTAIGMYRRMGFRDIPSYNGSPMENLVYLKRALK